MRLAIIDNDGTVHEVTDDLEEYDLSSNLAALDLVEDIREVIDSLSSW